MRVQQLAAALDCSLQPAALAKDSRLVLAAEKTALRLQPAPRDAAIQAIPDVGSSRNLTESLVARQLVSQQNVQPPRILREAIGVSAVLAHRRMLCALQRSALLTSSQRAQGHAVIGSFQQPTDVTINTSSAQHIPKMARTRLLALCAVSAASAFAPRRSASPRQPAAARRRPAADDGRGEEWHLLADRAAREAHRGQGAVPELPRPRDRRVHKSKPSSTCARLRRPGRCLPAGLPDSLR